jgi:hypothetical protein
MSGHTVFRGAAMTFAAPVAFAFACGCSGPSSGLTPGPTPGDGGGEVTDTGGGSPESGGPGADGPTSCPMLTDGWMPYTALAEFQSEGGGTNDMYCSHSSTGGVESFQMTKNPAGMIQRCEMRVHNDYLTGANQFEGDVKIAEADNTCVHQVFLFLMLVGYPQNGGEIHEHSLNFLESGDFGRWVHVNTIHDTATHLAHVYLDCNLKYNLHDNPPPSGGWYDKYGLYGIQSMPPVGQVSAAQWRNVKFYRK